MKKITGIVIIVALIGICVVALIIPGRKAKAADYIELSVDDRIVYAEKELEKMKKKPYSVSEVLISLDASLDEAVNILPDDCEIISLMHIYKDGTSELSGGYTDCKGKSIGAIVDDYKQEVIRLAEQRLNESKKLLDDYYNQYKLDFSISDDEFDPDKINPEWESDISLTEIKNEVEFSKKRLDSAKNGEIHLRGIRVSAKNADLIKLLDNESVICIEKLNFDKNEIIVPIMK